MADLATTRAVCDARGGPDAYPYDPTIRLGTAGEGLEKLRYFSDRSMARMLYELFWRAAANVLDPDYHDRSKREADEAARARTEWLTAQVRRAMAGDYGRAATDAAREIIDDGYGRQRTDLRSLEEAWRAIDRARVR